MMVYQVGGAVRDELLGLPVQDRDYVVVGATPEEMIRQGFRPVGKDFPVFLHPRTHEEYALARTERKTAAGYKGFQVHASPEVTLEQDLARRDLTINAIARDPDGRLIDPYGGMSDIKAGILRHVSPAFVEDPVRILRVARFAARFEQFSIAPETLALMRAMVDNGEVDALVAERVWQEIAKGLMEKKPSRMFYSLRECGALERILPEVERLFGVPQPAQHHPEIDSGVHVMMVVDCAAARNYPLPVRFAALTHDLGKGATPPEEWPRHIAHEVRGFELIKPLCLRLRVPNDCRDLALVTARFHGLVHRTFELRPETLLKLLQETDALRHPQRFEQFLQACAADACGRSGFENHPFEAEDFLLQALKTAAAVDAGAVARQCEDPAAIKEHVAQARLTAIKEWLAQRRGTCP
ncbi:multifunctional CCA protein [Sulfurimicrobium lacus]|uniref:Multifunctional CCA protein n=1 Tax=Sulfurimicrobium lacus TaxID=2715678 RepID=A0A6F8VGL0_9PROT|nr:multifunctional CCA addition/repair protein [Sulfurimicrobium lacus]BCB28301.1 multifunctional CCA protein [Sulfurimicrobium lacus]